MHKGAAIDRARLNGTHITFNSERDISHITDEDIIREKLTQFGRANVPHQPMFYGAIESTKIKQTD